WGQDQARHAFSIPRQSSEQWCLPFLSTNPHLSTRVLPSYHITARLHSEADFQKDLAIQKDPQPPGVRPPKGRGVEAEKHRSRKHERVSSEKDTPSSVTPGPVNDGIRRTGHPESRVHSRSLPHADGFHESSEWLREKGCVHRFCQA